MTALAVALSLWGLLAFAAFWLWMERAHPARLASPADHQTAAALADHEKRLSDLTARVTGLSLAQGLKPTRRD